MMASQHAYQRIIIPKDAPFELRPSPGKGWGAYATRRIDKGTTILAERPVFVIRKHPSQLTSGDVASAMTRLTSAEKRALAPLFPPHAAASLYPLLAGAVFAENSFRIGGSAAAPAHGLFVVHSRLNHSCVPNCKVPSTALRDENSTTTTTTTTTTTLVSFATRTIGGGEELTFCYGADFEARTAADRRRALRFVCRCVACVPGTRFQRCSDLRRRLVRALGYLIRGVDIDGRKETPGVDMDGRKETPSGGRRLELIADRELGGMAERGELPLSSLFVYALLTMALLEAEGLLDQFELDSWLSDIRRQAKLFQAPSNAAMAWRAVEQPTAARGLFFAAGLFGRSDPIDGYLLEYAAGR